MAENNQISNISSNISDSSKPNSGRIYDYLLGGHHYFDIDEIAAKQIIKLTPFAPKLARLIRWFLGVGIRKAVECGFTQFLDFASGLPTVDHIHSITPVGTKVIYSDIDPITVAYAKEIIGENPIVRYETCDISEPKPLLESAAVKTLFVENHKVSIGFNGVCYFLTDEQIKHSMQVLYDWAAEGSILFLTDLDENKSADNQYFIELYKSMNQFFTGGRPKQTLEELIKPWKVEEPGFLTLEEWIGVTPSITNEIIKSYGGGGAYGGFLIK